MAERNLVSLLSRGLAQHLHIPNQTTPSAVARSCLINHQQVRHRLWANTRPILGWPRKTLANMQRKYPEPHTYNWRPYLPDDGSYTIRPLPIHKMAGRDMETGRVVVRTLGGGTPKKFRWADMYRSANEDGSPKQERILQLKYDALHTPLLALVADEERTRWIPASGNVDVGDIITTYSDIPRNPVKAKLGDAHPLGALPMGTEVHLIERTPGGGAKFCLVAGASALITKRSPDGVTVMMSHGDQFKLDKHCMAVVGKVSRDGHRDVKLHCPQRKRWMGKRPRSGQWHRKDGYCGRKIRPHKFIDITMQAKEAKIAQQKEKELFDFVN